MISNNLWWAIVAVALVGCGASTVVMDAGGQDSGAPDAGGTADAGSDPRVSISDATALAEGDAGTTTATFNVTLSAPSTRQVSVSYATTDASAVSSGSPAAGGSDYVGANGTLTFAPGVTTQSISVTVNGDATREGTENYFVNLSAPLNATLDDGQAIGLITNDDPVPAASISDVTSAEGTGAGVTPFGFVVTLSNPSAATLTLNFQTANGTATAADFTPTSGVLTFSPGVTSQPIVVNVTRDALVEPTEGFVVNLANPSNATLLDGQGSGTISNDD